MPTFAELWTEEARLNGIPVGTAFVTRGFIYPRATAIDEHS